jgi:flagellar motor protein MotB
LIPTLPRADVDIAFDYKSSGLNARSEPALQELGQALADPRMRNYRYVVVGHTDAAEGRDDDLPLSEDRAAAVREYLVKNYGVAPERIVSIGFGKGRPKEAGNPLSPVNRRVEIINLGERP